MHSINRAHAQHSLQECSATTLPATQQSRVAPFKIPAPLIYTDADVQRFLSFVEKLPNGCHFWAGARSRSKGNKKWYGSFWLPSGSVRAHRFSCEALGKRAPLPASQHRDHNCCFSLCVNDNHIDYVTHAENERLKWQRYDADLIKATR